MNSALDVRGVTKRFGTFTAIDDVTVAFAPGQIHAVVGQNGAGKTTFSRLVCGLTEPSAGQVTVLGSPLSAGDIRSARAQGIDMVHQNFSLPPSFTVAEALELFDSGAQPISSRTAINRKWAAVLERYGSRVSVRKRVRDLSVESRQSLEIIRALEGKPKVLILDEPTAVLAPPEVSALFARVRSLRDSGLTILVILHKLSEVFALADTVTVLREGKLVLAPTPISEVSAEQLTRDIVGPDTSIPTVHPRAAGESDRGESDRGESTPENAVVSLSGASTGPGHNDRALNDVTLAVAEGEILGIAGVEGNGQETLLDVLSGYQRLTAGRLTLTGADSTADSVLTRRRRGLRFVPSDRNSQGISLTTSLWENVTLSALLIGRKRWLSPRASKLAVAHQLATWKVRYRGLDQHAGELSGGNVQRVILARELSGDVKLVIAGNPTRGLDLAATAFVRSSLAELASTGVAVILVSADLDEVREISHRICVLRGGRISATLPSNATVLEIGAAMVGDADVEK